MKRPILVVLLLALTGVVCLVVIVAGWVATLLPLQAEGVFGSPSETLSAIQRLALSVQLLSQERDLLTPRDPGGPPQPFTIELGEPTFSVTNRLQQEGLVEDAEVLRIFLIYSGLDTTIQAGEYTLSARMTPVEIAQALQDATPTEVTFIILAGWRLEEVAAALPTSGLTFSPRDFLAYAQQPSLAQPAVSGLPAGTGLEGFMLPDRYEVPRVTGVQEFVRIVLENFERQVGAELRQGFEYQGLDLYQAVTMASIVEREAVLDEEMPQIAGVFLNRLRVGMRLDSDPTVQYALGQVQSALPGAEPGRMTWWKNPLSLDDLQIDSPYNTYQITGLPPGPISNPGLNAMRAVAHPAETPYYYFRAACDNSGRHVFAETLEQHQQNACP